MKKKFKLKDDKLDKFKGSESYNWKIPSLWEPKFQNDSVDSLIKILK